MTFSVAFALFFRTIDGLLRYGTVRYGTVRYGTVRYGTVRYGTVRYGTVRYGALKNSDKFALPTVLSLRQKPKKIQKSVRFRFSTGTKSSKTAQKSFSKNRQDVFSTRYQP
jgi:hypothetical protein